jgi:hypothetical protein
LIHLRKGKKTGRFFVTHHNKYYRNSATGTWIKFSSLAKQLASGNIGGIHDDLAGVWNDGLWVRYSANSSWQKIDSP